MPFCRTSGEYCCVGYKMHPVEKICVRKLSVELKKIMFKGIHIHVMYSENIQYIFIFSNL